MESYWISRCLWQDHAFKDFLQKLQLHGNSTTVAEEKRPKCDNKIYPYQKEEIVESGKLR
jgi:hypothetical protein